MLVLIAAADAATPVLSDDPPEAAVARVAERTGLPIDALSPAPLADAFAPGVPDATPCAGPPVTAAELGARLDALIAAHDAGRFDDARAGALALADAPACLTDAVDPGWSWSARFVIGLVAWGDGDEAAARRSWSWARGIDPHRPWDEDFAPVGGALGAFATALPGSTVPFRAVGGPFTIDGRPAGDSVPEGAHVLQAGDPLQTWLVDLRGPVVAVHPDADPAVLPIGDVAAVVAARRTEDVAYVVRGDEVARIALPSGAVDIVAPLPPPPPRWQQIRGRVIAGTGGALVAGGGTGIVTNGVRMGQAWEAGREAFLGANGDTHTAAESAWGRAQTALLGWSGVAGGGLVLVAVGVVDEVR
jgi:hypothetical protein